MQNAMPLFYRSPVAINSEIHLNSRIARSKDKFRFASSANFVLVTAVEFIDASKTYPLIFSEGANGEVVSLALLGLENGENLFVDHLTGEWSANYVPAYVRRYPFIPADVGSESFPVCVDQEYEGFGTEEGERLFDEDGTATEYCRQVQAFLSDYQQQSLVTQGFAQKLKALGLLKSMDLNIQDLQGQNFAVQGFLIVDEEKLKGLDDEEVLSLFREGYLALIYMHLGSLRNLSRLIDLKAKRLSENAQAKLS